MGLAAGMAAVVLFLAGAVLVADRPAFDASGDELRAYLSAETTRVQLAAALDAAAAALLVWFLATLTANERGVAARVAFAAGVAWVVIFTVDVAALATAALRPVSADTARTLVDLEFMLIGLATPFAVAMLLAFAALWRDLLGRLAALAAVLYAVRIGTVFTTDGPFAADGALGLWVPVAAMVGWIATTSITRTTT